MKKLFIVFEGIDGAGSSTQANLLQEYFHKQGQKSVLSPEPSSGIIGNLVRESLKQRIIFTRNTEKFNELMAYLFAADRYDHLYNDFDGVFKLIEDGFHVITTRYYFSSLAYNCHTASEFALVKDLNQRFPNPDIVIYLDLPIEVSLARIQDRSLQEIYETEEKLTQVRSNYWRIFQDYNGLLLQLDATENLLDLHQKIVDFIDCKCL